MFHLVYNENEISLIFFERDKLTFWLNTWLENLIFVFFYEKLKHYEISRIREREKKRQRDVWKPIIKIVQKHLEGADQSC